MIFFEESNMKVEYISSQGKLQSGIRHKNYTESEALAVTWNSCLISSNNESNIS